MPDAAALPPVHASILTIPDGMTADVLRISLQIAPAVDPAAASVRAPDVALAAWPAQVAGMLNRLRVHLAPIDAAGKIDKSRTIPIGGTGQFRPASWTGRPAPGADRLWKATFPAGFQSLWSELQKIGDPAGAEADAARLVLAPTIDSQGLARSLVDTHVRAARDRINWLATGAKGSAAPSKHAERTMEAWAIPGSSANSHNAVGNELAKERAAAVVAAITAALEGLAGSPPQWARFTSFAMLDAFANGERLQGRSDERLERALAAARPADADELITSRLKSVAITIPQLDPAKPPVDPPASEPGENERRKLAAILAYPTIAKYLGLIVDLTIPRADWDAVAGAAGLSERGAIAVTWGDEPAPPGAAAAGPGGQGAPPTPGNAAAAPSEAPDALANWTAYLCAPRRASGLPAYFGPAGRAEATGGAVGNEKLIRGILNLAATRDEEGRPPRFSLSVVDAVNSAKRQVNHAREALKGDDLKVEDNAELGGRGIALIDSGAQKDEEASRKAAADLTSPGDRLQFAEDLLIGYRPIVGLAPKVGESLAIAPSRWRSLVARTVSFGSAIDPAFVRANYDAERENGHTRSPVGVQNAGSYDIVLNHPELFVWSGDSLAVPARSEDPADGVVVIDPATDLPVDIAYSLPDARAASHTGLMPLRDGRRYAFAAGAMFVNGCGPSVEETIAAAAADQRLVLGQDGKAFTFVRCEMVPPPVVLLPADSPLVTAANLKGYPGETLTTLVLRLEEAEDRTVRRFLFPARVAFERAEQQAMFDDDRRATPAGAFGSAATIGARRDRQTGAFPEAPSRRGPRLDIESPADGVVRHEYYPDGYTRGVWAHFHPVHPADAKITRMAAPTPFRTKTSAISASPVLLEIKKRIAYRSETGPRVEIDTTAQRYEPPELPGARMRKVTIAMAPATMAEIDLVADVEAGKILSTHIVGQALDRLWGSGAKPLGPEERRAKLARAMAEGRINEIQGATRLRIVHAVKVPLHPPAILSRFAPALVSARTPNDPDKNSPLKTWADVVKKNREDLVPLNKWSEEGGSTCFFVGEISVDAPSTGTVSCDGEWEDWGPEMVRFNRKSNEWECYRAKQFARLFTLTNIPSTAVSRDISLHDLDRAPLGLAYTFRDGRARQLSLTLIAQSRFAEYYNAPAPNADTYGMIGPCELAAKSDVPHWVPCNFRPAQPIIDRVTPLLETKTTGRAKDQKFTFERETSFRIELGEGCFGSGEGEQLALVFNANGSTEICDYSEELLRPYASGVTRWGRDPLYDGSLPSTNVLPEFFGGYTKIHNGFSLPASADPTDPDKTARKPLPATVLAYDLTLDKGSGVFYVDISTNGSNDAFANTYMPFVQLGLARLQVKAVQGLELSVPVGQMVQVLPRRSGSVTFQKKGDGLKLDFDLHAPKGKNADPAQQWILEVTALEWDPRNGGRWIPQNDSVSHTVIQNRQVMPNENGDVFPNWHVDGFKMEKSRLKHRVGLLIEEFESVPLPDGTTFKRLIFGHTIDFGPP